MKKRVSVIVLALILGAIVMSSCKAHPKCPGVYSQSEPIVKVKHI